MLATNSNACESQVNCKDAGSFDQSSSATFSTSDLGTFSQQFEDATGASGNYFSDTLAIGQITIRNQTMGLANQSTLQYGLCRFYSIDSFLCLMHESPKEFHFSVG